MDAADSSRESEIRVNLNITQQGTEGNCSLEGAALFTETDSAINFTKMNMNINW